MTSNALVRELPLRPVRLLREANTVKVHYLDTGAELRLDREQPVHVMHSVTANDDATVVEVCGSNSVAVQQVTDDGETQTLVLSAAMAIELAHLLNSFVFFPVGLNAE